MSIETASEDDITGASLRKEIGSRDRWGAIAEKDFLLEPILAGRIRRFDLFPNLQSPFSVSKRGRQRFGP